MASVKRAPGRLRVREQPLRRVHADGRRPPPAPTSPPAPPPTPCPRRSSTATTCGRCTPPPREAVARARAGEGPTLLECQTYRHYGHSKSDPAPYRTKEELERWLERDPLKLARAPAAAGGLPEEEIAAVEQADHRRARSGRRERPGRALPRSRRRRGHGVRAVSDARVPRRHPRRARRGARARPRRWCSSARTSPPPAGCSRPPPSCSSASAPTASSTPRSPSWPSPAPPTAPPSPACARCSR